MDAWNPDQLKRMQLGGNDKLNSFLGQYGISKATDIRDKYNSKAAEFYREKIRWVLVVGGIFSILSAVPWLRAQPREDAVRVVCAVQYKCNINLQDGRIPQ